MNIIDAFFADPWIGIGNIIAASYLVPLAVFVLWYGFRSPWWGNELGIALLLQKISFFAVFSLITVAITLNDWPGRAALRILIYGVVGFTLWLDVVNLRRIQKRHEFRVFDPDVRRPKLREIARRYIRPGDR